MTYLEIEIPRTGFEQDLVEVVQRQPMNLREGDDVEVVVRGRVVLDRGALALVAARVLRVQRIRRG